MAMQREPARIIVVAQSPPREHLGHRRWGSRSPRRRSLSYGNRHADLLFEVVTRRYAAGKPIVITTNKSFEDWNQVFPSAACVVTLVDRLVHRSEILTVKGESYRLKEAKERAAEKAKLRGSAE